jgi:putative ABC transport system permease protein
MISNYLRTALRSFKNNKGVSAINIIGLAAGIAACILIVIYVKDELSYDRYNVNAGQIYRITENVSLNGHEGSYAGTEKPLKPAIQHVQGIEKITRLIPVTSLFLSPNKFFVKKGNEVIEENKVVYAESDLFEVFTLPVIDGNVAGSLTDPNTAVITESTAKKYFNRTNVVGETITINDSGFYRVTAVIKDVPAQSHFNYNFFLSYSSIPESQIDGWGYSGIHNYVLVKPTVSISNLEKEIQAIAIGHYPPAITSGSNYLKVKLTPLLDIHLRSKSQYEIDKGGSIQFVYIFSVIAFFILLIACINFINLSTARSANRAREVGVRKVIGSSRGNLIGQFLTESVLLTFISAVLAVVIVRLMLPYFNQVADKRLSITGQSFLSSLTVLLLVVLLVGALAGIYPALYLSGFKPIVVLKGRLAAGFKRSFLRSALVVFQFSVSIFLIISTLVVYNQLSYMHSKDIGFNKSQMLVIKNTGRLGNGIDNFKQELKQIPGVEGVTISGFSPTGRERNITGLFPQLPIDIKQDVLAEFWRVDEDYVKTMGMQLAGGRNFSNRLASDSSAIIVNEAFVKKMGLKDPLNKMVYRNSFGVQSYHIVGVVKDFNFSSLRENVRPLVLVNERDNGAITARVRGANLPMLMVQIETKWKQLAGNFPFTYSFMDEDFEAIYRAEQRMKQIFVSFSVLAIVIACLGLFGLTAFAAEQRNKEIAIRKVIGAGTGKIINLMSADFIKLVCISILIASPLGWFAMNKWLEDFAYRISIGLSVFLIAGIMALAIAAITISFQTVRAALANPVKSLRTE